MNPRWRRETGLPTPLVEQAACERPVVSDPLSEIVGLLQPRAVLTRPHRSAPPAWENGR